MGQPVARVTERPARTRGVWIVLLLVVLILSPILYGVSFAPAWHLLDKGLISRQTFLTMYRPWMWMEKQVPGLENASDWWVGVWLSDD